MKYHASNSALGCIYSLQHFSQLFFPVERKAYRGTFCSVEHVKLNLDNPFQEQEFNGSKCCMGEIFVVIVEKKDAQIHIPILC